MLAERGVSFGAVLEDGERMLATGGASDVLTLAATTLAVIVALGFAAGLI